MAKFTPLVLEASYAAISQLNQNFDEIADQLENTISRDGTAPNSMLVPLDMNHFKIENLADGTANTDAVNVEQMDAAVSLWVSTVEGYKNSASVSAIAAATSAQDAANTYEAIQGLLFGVDVSTAILPVTSRLILATANTGIPCLLTETGREGIFIFKAGDFSAQVTADPQQGLYVAPTADVTGATGAWVRHFSGKANALWWGLSTAGSAAANQTAITAAITLLKALRVTGSGYTDQSIGLYIPAGQYNLNAELELTHGIQIEGDASASPGGSGTVLIWPADSHGFDLQTGGVKLKKLTLQGGYTVSSGEYHGVKMRAPCELEDIYVVQFQGDGINGHAISPANGGVGETAGNCNGSIINRVFLIGNRNGIKMEGADANACTFSGVRAFANREWGITDASFLGNTYIHPETAANAGGPFRTSGLDNVTVMLNPYSESDQPASSFSSRTLVLGGLHGAGLNTSAYIAAQGNRVTMPNVDVSNEVTSSTVLTGSVRAVNNGPVSAFAGYDNGDYVRLQGNMNVAGSLIGPGIRANNEATGSKNLSIAATSLVYYYGPTGGFQWAVDNTGMNLNSGNIMIGGVAKVSSIHPNHGQIAAQNDSVAADVATLKADFNGLLAKMRTANILAT